MNPRWVGGNRIELLENGEAFFPAVFGAIEAAQQEVMLETFILFEDKVGQQLHRVLLAAAQRGVRVDILVDGFGSADLTTGFIRALTEAGVRFRIFDPGPRLFGLRPKMLRRMHRKLVVVDGVQAFVGGINYSADHLADYGPEAKQDYAVRVHGPIVEQIHRFMHDAIAPGGPRRWFRRRTGLGTAAAQSSAEGAQALFVTRDNREHRNDIERHYRAAIRSARQRVVIANAYFFPGYLLLRQLRRAARRGVQVQLILQGEPDMAIVKVGAELLYEHLQRDGVQIYEYCKRPLHGKVALVDDVWSTVGSSNLDPLSLSLNLESNLIIRDAAFNEHLHDRLQHLVRHDCKQAPRQPKPRWALWHQMRSVIVFHVLRHFPTWAHWLPTHQPVLHMAHEAEPAAVTAVQEPASEPTHAPAREQPHAN
jgi:cardiolipin synthase A/B